MSSSTELITSIPQISGTITALSAFFYQSRSQEIARVNTEYQDELNHIRDSVIEQSFAFKQTVVEATMEAEGGQAIARRIIYLLKKIKTKPSTDVLEDLLESLQEKIEVQLARVEQVKSGFEGIRSGILKISAERTDMHAQITSDQKNALAEAKKAATKAKRLGGAAVLTSWTVVGGLYFGHLAFEQSMDKSAAKEKYQAATQASGILDVMCDGISDVVDILTRHVDFWSDLSARITAQLVELTPEKLIKNNGKIKIGNVEQSEEEWGHVEVLYKQYASTARLAKPIDA